MCAALLLLPAAPFWTGCSMLPNHRLAACEAEKQQLLARIERDQHELQALRADQQRLAEAEKQLARIYDAQSTERLASLPEAPTAPLYTPPDDAKSP